MRCPERFAQRLVILPGLASDPEWVALFQAEARVLATLRHPNIVAIQDLGQEGEVWWMALELVEGLDLRTILDRLRERGERMPPELVAHIAIEVADALSYAHAREVIHRDVTPGNILVTDQGGVKLTDFGIAKTPNSERTRTGFVKGKAHYMSPEQTLRPREIYARTDIFALGVVCFEALAGERPFRGKTELAVHTSKVSGDRKALRELAPEVRPELAALVESMLAIEPSERAESADAIVDALAAITARSAARALALLVRRLSAA